MSQKYAQKPKAKNKQTKMKQKGENLQFSWKQENTMLSNYYDIKVVCYCFFIFYNFIMVLVDT